MADSVVTRKPAKPYPDRPLIAQFIGRWAREIRGRIYDFGRWNDPDGTLASYIDQLDGLHAGRTRRPRRFGGPASLHGFTLVELVVVVMILGIIAAIAVPRLLGTVDTASENGLEHTLSVIRTAIDRFAAEHGDVLPGADGNEATFKADMASYLRGSEFPTCPVGAAQNNKVRMMGGTGSIVPGIGATATTHSWVYKFETGDFHVNSTDAAANGSRTFDRF